MKKGVYPLASGDHVANVKTIRNGSKLCCVTGRLRVSEHGRSFEIVYNPKNCKLTIYHAWQLSQIVGTARYKAIEDALLLFLGGISATLTR